MTKMAPNATHPLIAELCVEMAQSVYESSAKGNNFYKLYPEPHGRKNFVREVAPTLRQQAVTILAEMLNRHDVPDSEKEKIYEALLLDKETPNPHTWEVPNLDTSEWNEK